MTQGKLARRACVVVACWAVLGAARAHAAAVAGAADRVLTLVNQERARAGLAPLTIDPQLTTSAQTFSEYMASANFYAHNGPDGSTPPTRMTAAGFPGTGTWGENIAAYYSDADAVMQLWMASPAHRANILNPAFTQIGIGVAFNPNSQWKYYWTQDFAVRRGGSAAGAPVPGTPQPQSPPPLPVLRTISPAQGAVGGRVALIGHDFGERAGTVSFSGTAAHIMRWSNTRIEVQVPAGASSGAVYVQNARGTSAGVDFTVLTGGPPPSPGTPEAAYLYPTAGNPGMRVTLYGRGFGASVGQVLFNGVPGQVAFWYDTLIGVDVPAGAASGPVIVHTAAGNTNALPFTVNSGDPTATQPQLVYCSPAAGAAGTQVSVIGQNLGDSPGTVSFNGVAATILNWTSTAVVVIVPQGATTGPVTLQTGGGTSNSVTFTVVSPSQPAPPQPSPGPSGGGSPGGGGQQPSGSGTGTAAPGALTPRPATTLPPAPAPQPAPTDGLPLSGDRGIAARLPSGSPPAAPDGRPAAATLAPAAAAPGSSITIRGSNFGAATGRVRVGRTSARVLSWTDTVIVAQVPPGVGTTGRFPVTVVRRDNKYTAPLYLTLVPSS